MSVADRRARELARQQADKARRDATNRAASEVRTRSALVAEGEQLAATVLAQLASLDYPRMESITVSEPRLGLTSGRFGYRRRTKAAWPITQDQHHQYEDSFMVPVYLLADGRFQHYGSTPFTLRDADARGVSTTPCTARRSL